jgi:hypothetical protein
VFLYFPASQIEHEEASPDNKLGSTENVPAGHDLQVLDPEVAYSPGWQ